MRFVPVKSVDAQSMLALHATRQGFVQARTAVINRLRGLLSEFGIVLPLKAQTVRGRAGEVLETLPGWARFSCSDLMGELHHLDEKVETYDTHIRLSAQHDARCRRLMQVPGIGPTIASALRASIGAGHDFDNGRQLASWLGLVPGQ